MDDQAPILLTGATGYVGGHLLDALHERGLPVRALARNPDVRTFPDGVEAFRGDVLSGEGLAKALEGARVAYYLVHSMGRGGSAKDFAERDRKAARTFGRAAQSAGVKRVVYLGGLGPTGPDASEHLRSRHEVAQVLAEEVDDLIYLRAAMVIGDGSASFEMLRALVKRLPAMICPRWIDTRSQPVALPDVVETLVRVGERVDIEGEIQIGGADVLTYREMMERFARIVGKRPPVIVRVPVLTPRLSSYWVTLVTPVESGLVRPLVDGLRSEMIVERSPPTGINVAPMGFEAAVRIAL